MGLSERINEIKTAIRYRTVKAKGGDAGSVFPSNDAETTRPVEAKMLIPRPARRSDLSRCSSASGINAIDPGDRDRDRDFSPRREILPGQCTRP
jgi:hypothetical protein